MKWKVLKKYQTYNQKKKQCILCRNEKYETVCYKRDNLLIKRTETLVHVETGTNLNLETATQKTDVIYQFYNVIKDTITLI